MDTENNTDSHDRRRDHCRDLAEGRLTGSDRSHAAQAILQAEPDPLVVAAQEEVVRLLSALTRQIMAHHDKAGTDQPT